MVHPSWIKALMSATILGATALSTVHAEDTKKVYVTAIVEHPSLDAARDGAKEALEEAGFVSGKNLRWQYQSAQGNTSTAAQIARKFVGDKPDAIIAISTPSAQTILAATKSIPIVFTTVTDPIAAQLVPSQAANKGNVTGMSDQLPVEEQVALIRKILPNAKRIGIVYNSGEANSVSVVKKLKGLLQKENMTLVEATAPRTVDVSTAAKSLAGKVDAIYINTDNNAVASIESIAKVADDNKIPLFASDSLSAKRGAFLTFSIDYHELGRETGKMVARILKGEKPGDIPYATLNKFEITVNKSAAKRQSVEVPEDILKEAKIIE